MIPVLKTENATNINRLSTFVPVYTDIRILLVFVCIFQNFEKAVDDKRRALKELKRVIKERTEENAGLTKELEELNVSVNERRNIHEVNGMLFKFYLKDFCSLCNIDSTVKVG